MTASSSHPANKFTLLPAHIAIVPDGNGRWAEKRGLPRTEGHREGIENMYRMVEYINEYDVPFITLYGFSTENWLRPEEEVYGLFSMLTDFITRVKPEIQKNRIRLNHIGRMNELPDDFQMALTEAVEATKDNDGITLNIAFNYGGRAEIVDAVRGIIDDGIKSTDITEDIIERYLYTTGIPDVDLVIRTSDERRLSNFLLWQTSYSEICFSEALWPDFTQQDLDKALEFYNQRKRRFGGL